MTHQGPTSQPAPADSAEWIRTDEFEEAIGALESVSRFLDEARRDPLSWRWVIIALHIATQGFMVIALRDSAGLTPLRDSVAAAWLKAYRSGEKLPDEKLDSFRNLYKKIKRRNIAAALSATAFEPTGSQERSVRMLCDLRDQFVHFVPTSWSIEIAGLPQMCADTLDLIEYLCQRYRTILWHNEGHPGRASESIAAARARLGRS